MPIKAERGIAAPDPYRLIAGAARRSLRRRRLDAFVPALPPCAALLAAWLLGRLPLEVAAASLIALGILLLYVASIEISPAAAAAFLDRALGAKEHFLTLATLPGGGGLRGVVEAGAVEIASRAPEPSLPPRRKRPLVASLLLSAAGFAVLWVVPRFAAPAVAGDSLQAIAAELQASPDATDRKLAGDLREVVRVLGDPRSSIAERLAKVKSAIEEIEAAEGKKSALPNAGSSAGEEGKGQGGGRKAKGGTSQGNGTGEQAGAEGKQQGEEQGGGGAGSARGRAREQLSKLAGELSAAAQGQAAAGQKEQQEKQEKPKAEGGGLQGPESSAEERKTAAREATGNQPGERPDQHGGAQNQGGEQGEGAQAQNRPQNAPQPQGPGAGGGSSAEGARGGPTSAPSSPAPRYYGPGEGPDGRIADGRYVRVRVPQDQHLLQGTEEVAKPGDVAPKVGYGNAPLPQEGSPGKISMDQPLPLEYRGALGQGAR